MHDKTNQNQRENAIKIALDTYKIIKGKIIVHWQKNSEVLREMKNALDDYFYDVVGKKMEINFNTKNLSKRVSGNFCDLFFIKVWVCQIFCVSMISPFAQFCKLVSQSIAKPL